MTNSNILDYLLKPVNSDVWRDLLSSWEQPKRTEFAELEILDFPQRGVQIYVNSRGVVVTIFLFGDGVDGHHECVIPLPLGLEFSLSGYAVRQALGEPGNIGINENHLAWMKYFFPKCALHVEFFNDKDQIRIITVMAELREIVSA